MKTKIVSIIGLATFAVVMAFNINASMNNSTETDIALANVEALVSGEVTGSCCIGSNFKITAIPGGWHCANNTGNSCCPVC